MLQDMEETEEDIRGEMSDDLHLLDLEAGKFHSLTLKVEQPVSAAVNVAEAPTNTPTERTVEGNYPLTSLLNSKTVFFYILKVKNS